MCDNYFWPVEHRHGIQIFKPPSLCFTFDIPCICVFKGAEGVAFLEKGEFCVICDETLPKRDFNITLEMI